MVKESDEERKREREREREREKQSGACSGCMAPIIIEYIYIIIICTGTCWTVIV